MYRSGSTSRNSARRLHGIFRTPAKLLNNERGVALITALILGLIGMLMVAALLLMVDTGTWVTGSKNRYQMALSSAYGGMDFFAKEIIQRGISGTGLSSMGSYGTLNFSPSISDTEMKTKLTTSGTYSSTAPDMTITFANTSGKNISIEVKSTIVGTSRGNSSASSSSTQLLTGGVVNSGSGTITPQHIPYVYQIETQAQGVRQENAALRAIYIY